MDKLKLKQCPFCGHVYPMKQRGPAMTNNRRDTRITCRHCPNCGAVVVG